MTGTDLVYSSASLDQRKQYAQALAAAGSLLPPGLMDGGRPSPGKILLVAETGNMLGIHPVAAITGINIIQGKPSVAPALMSALVRERGHKLRVKVTGTVATGDLAVTVTLIRKDDPEAPFEVKWTMQDAIDAGLVDSYALDVKTKTWTIKPASGKGTWKQYPRQMLLHRATAEVCRQGANEVVMGVYTPEELGATVNSEGEMVDVTATAIDRTYEQDHDGPNVAEAMRAESSNPDQEPLVSRKSGHASEREVVTRAVDERTPDAGKRPGRPRPAQAQAAGAADPAEQAAVAADWIGRITDTDTLDALYDLHKEAAARHVLEHTLSTGRSVEDVFLTRREELQNPPEPEQPVLVPDYTDETPF